MSRLGNQIENAMTGGLMQRKQSPDQGGDTSECMHMKGKES